MIKNTSDFLATDAGSTTTPLIAFNPESLNAFADAHRDTYVSGNPFPHIVIDDFLPEHVLERVLDEFPSPQEKKWIEFDRAEEKKLATKHELQIGAYTRHLIAQLNSATFIHFLEKLTDIEEGLIPDPHLEGGGLHQIVRGGHLKVHADFNVHLKLNLDRRLNLIVYLNKEWEESYGGYLELWNKEMTEAVEKVLPLFNRCVIFSTTSNSYHGHPDTLNCPDDRSRKSLALYYYSNGRPAHEVADGHNTLFQARPGDTPAEHTLSLKEIARKLVPPICVDAIRWLRRRD